MKNSSISYIIAFFLCSLACHATVVLPNKTTQPLLSVSQQQTYKVSGTVIDAKTHTIIPEAIILLKNLTTGQENTYSCDQYGTYTVVLDVNRATCYRQLRRDMSPLSKSPSRRTAMIQSKHRLKCLILRSLKSDLQLVTNN